ncbi:MAG TPA: hypothetical protein DIW51_00660, partial [Rhodospirillaceae bacterium]|nr:hypothetical protein [Rhodospirillaceae bacterium]
GWTKGGETLALTATIEDIIPLLGRVYPGWTRSELMALTPQRLTRLIPKPKTGGGKTRRRRTR